jgi:sugar phosphate isomerase/epimerase
MWRKQLAPTGVIFEKWDIKNMEIICASICYRGWAEDEVEATLRHAPSIGYHAMEVHGPLTWSLEAIQRFDLPALRSRIRQSGMCCAGLYTPGWGGEDDADAIAHAQAIAKCAEYAEQLGARHITSTGASRRGESGALERVMLCVGKVLETISPHNPVRLALEPHYGNILEQPEDFEQILTAFPDPRLGICVDTGHFHSAGVDMPLLIHRFAWRIYSVHLKDHLGSRSVGIGRGEVDLPGVITALKEVGYQGGLTVELEVEDPENLPKYTEEAYIYLTGLLGQKLGE